MAVLVWDQVGERKFASGVDRGVLYYNSNSNAVAWNGLTSVEEFSTSETKPLYIDGRKYLDSVVLGEFAGKLKAFTYPDIFDFLNGVVEDEASGMMIHDQPPKSFGLSYRTRLGNDTEGADHGYRIHILYNLTSIPDSIGHSTISERPNPVEFGWTLLGRPVIVSGHRFTSHISFITSRLSSDALEILEGTIYGSDISDGRLPSITELLTLLSA